jgi:phosphoribosylanthranilate isomerase
VERVGVFVDAPLADVREAIRDCALDRVQLGGRETPAYCVALDGRAVKTLRLPGDQDLFGSYAVPLFHLDTPHARLAGGTGQSWSYALARSITAKYPVLLAGGLRPDNVAQAIVAARPFGVDVCSGVETDRRKDPDKIEAFIRNVRAAVETLCATG